jgi:hypothetical protein
MGWILFSADAKIFLFATMTKPVVAEDIFKVDLGKAGCDDVNLIELT